jgi:hypothetical protein
MFCASGYTKSSRTNKMTGAVKPSVRKVLLFSLGRASFTRRRTVLRVQSVSIELDVPRGRRQLRSSGIEWGAALDRTPLESVA